MNAYHLPLTSYISPTVHRPQSLNLDKIIRVRTYSKLYIYSQIYKIVKIPNVCYVIYPLLSTSVYYCKLSKQWDHSKENLNFLHQKQRMTNSENGACGL